MSFMEITTGKCLWFHVFHYHYNPWSTFVKSQSTVHVQIVWCWLLFEDDGQREKGLSVVRLPSAPSTASGMWSASILGLIKILLKAISLDQSARYRTWEKQDLRRKRQERGLEANHTSHLRPLFLGLTEQYTTLSVSSPFSKLKVKSDSCYCATTLLLACCCTEQTPLVASNPHQTIEKKLRWKWWAYNVISVKKTTSTSPGQSLNKLVTGKKNICTGAVVGQG